MKVVRGSAEWGTCTRTVSHYNYSLSLAYWSNTIAAGLGCDIIFFGAVTGSQVAVLSGHTGQVRSLAFSSDGTFLVSGSEDKTVRLWDVQTGRVVKTLYGHTEQIRSVSISADNTIIASGSNDKQVRLWNIKTGNCCIIEGHKDCVKTVTFSPTNPQLLLAFDSGIVQQWGTDGYEIGSSIPGRYAAFSPDGTQFVLIKGKTVTIRNTDSRMTVVEFNLTHSIPYCCFSPNGSLIAFPVGGIIHIWNTTGQGPHLIQTLSRHTGRITALVFSSSLTLTSASTDSSVKFWQVNTSPADPSTPSAESTSPTSAQIMSVSLQAKDGLAFSIDLNGVVKSWDILTGCCKKSYKTRAKDIINADMQLIGGRLILVWSGIIIGQIYVEDVEKGIRLQTVHTPYSYIKDLRISGDESKILQLGDDFIQAWELWAGESIGEKQLESNNGYFASIRMDGSKVLVYLGKSVQGWDFGELDSVPTQFPVASLAMPDLNLVETGVRGLGDRWLEFTLVRIEDGLTRKEVFQLCGRYANPTAMQWDGQYLIAGYRLGEVLILDFSHVLSSRDL